MSPEPLTEKEKNYLNYGPTPLELECTECGAQFSRCAISESFGCNTTDDDVLKQTCIEIINGEFCGGSLKRLIPKNPNQLDEYPSFTDALKSGTWDGIREHNTPEKSEENLRRNEKGYND